MTGHITNLHPDLLTKLQDLEKLFGHALDITSGYRDPDHNQDVGGVPDSAHTHDPSLAVDIAVSNGSERFALITLALRLGFVRIGVGKTFIHLDIDMDKPTRVIWEYSK